MFLTSILNAVVAFLGGALTTIGKVVPGIANNPIYVEVENDLAGYKVLEANYAADYADLAPFSHDGVAGRIIVVKQGGPLGNYIGI